MKVKYRDRDSPFWLYVFILGVCFIPIFIFLVIDFLYDLPALGRWYYVLILVFECVPGVIILLCFWGMVRESWPSDAGVQAEEVGVFTHRGVRSTTLLHQTDTVPQFAQVFVVSTVPEENTLTKQITFSDGLSANVTVKYGLVPDTTSAGQIWKLKDHPSVPNKLAKRIELHLDTYRTTDRDSFLQAIPDVESTLRAGLNAAEYGLALEWLSITTPENIPDPVRERAAAAAKRRARLRELETEARRGRETDPAKRKEISRLRMEIADEE